MSRATQRDIDQDIRASERAQDQVIRARERAEDRNFQLRNRNRTDRDLLFGLATETPLFQELPSELLQQPQPLQVEDTQDIDPTQTEQQLAETATVDVEQEAIEDAELNTAIDEFLARDRTFSRAPGARSELTRTGEILAEADALERSLVSQLNERVNADFTEPFNTGRNQFVDRLTEQGQAELDRGLADIAEQRTQLVRDLVIQELNQENAADESDIAVGDGISDNNITAINQATPDAGTTSIDELRLNPDVVQEIVRINDENDKVNFDPEGVQALLERVGVDPSQLTIEQLNEIASRGF